MASHTSAAAVATADEQAFSTSQSAAGALRSVHTALLYCPPAALSVPCPPSVRLGGTTWRQGSPIMPAGNGSGDGKRTKHDDFTSASLLQLSLRSCWQQMGFTTSLVNYIVTVYVCVLKQLNPTNPNMFTSTLRCLSATFIRRSLFSSFPVFDTTEL